MPTQNKPSIVFAHGLWADGSCFSKVIPVLQADGYEVMSTQNSLDSLKGDVEAVTRGTGRVSSPAILVGHSYGGTVSTAAGNDERRPLARVHRRTRAGRRRDLAGLQDKFPKTDVFGHIEIADGQVWLRPDGIDFCFAGDHRTGTEDRLGNPGRSGPRPLQPEDQGHCLEDEAELVHRREERPHRSP